MPIVPGSRLGPYEVLDLVGAGGMGEVYRASDPRLGREVAVKVLPAAVAGDPDRLARFEREARAVAALNHPNILTVFDVGTERPVATAGIEADKAATAIPYVVTELLQGETLREMSRRRTPTQRQVLSFAVQIAHGLDAAHAKGIVHRDVKPENVFVTTDGRVKVLDFGLAKLADRLTADSDEATDASPSHAGQIVGTVGFMSPEQVRGLPVDARTDVFSFGVLLYELLYGKHPFQRETKVATLTAILDDEPAELSSLGRGIPPAVSGIVRRCLAKPREERYGSAHDVAVALEAVLAAPAGAASLQEVEEKSPYPGLSSFTEKDAAQFFGREAEVKALWERLQSRSLSGVIGPSGAGKTSFVRAGVVASRPDAWAALVCTPGAAPFRGLGQALLPAFAGDLEALQSILSLDETAGFDLVSRWRRNHGEALLVVDQFEELFTLNPPDVQARFASLLGRLAREGDVHVLLSLRDDFLMRCAEHEPIVRVFESLSPLPALSTEGLRRALVEPAKARGFGFEDDGLVAEMLESVEGARGALPLLAFAVSRLWEKRDRERKLLTRAAYEEIGGVAGALAQHAEATMDRVGVEFQGIVREIFRNLATAQGTRAVADREELLSAFTADRPAAEEVLRELIDARLVTSYEVEAAEGQPGHRRVEVVHESLLKAWPRLVRWQMQDEEGAVLRDQLKQAAHLWEEKGCTSDLLWTGTAYQEFELWRSRYAGALTALEERFAGAMRERARRRRRVLTAAIATAFVVLLGVAGAIAVSRQQAVAARSRAEAARLVALGRVELDRYPTAALAYATRALETADNAEGRRLAVEALWRGPVARILPLDGNTACWRAAFSPDGRQLAAYTFSEYVQLFAAEGGPPRKLGGFPQAAGPQPIAFSPRGDALVAGWWEDVPVGDLLRLREVSVPDGRERRWVEVRGQRAQMFDQAASARGMIVGREEDGGNVLLELVPWDASPRRLLGTARQAALDLVTPAGDRLFLLREGRLVVRPLNGPVATVERTVATLPPGKPLGVRVSPRGEPVVTLRDAQGLYRALFTSDSTAGSRPRLFRVASPEAFFPPAFDAGGGRLAWSSSANQSVFVWDLDGPPDVEPLVMRRAGVNLNFAEGLFSPRGEWLAAASHESFTFWAASQPWVRILRRHSDGIASLQFTPDSASLVSCAGDGIGVWPMAARAGAGQLRPLENGCNSVVIPADGRQAAWVSVQGIQLGSAPGLAGRWLYRQTFSQASPVGAAFDAAGRTLALGTTYARKAQDLVLRVFDLASGAQRAIPLVPTGESFGGYEWSAYTLAFTRDGRLLAGGSGGIRRFDVATGASEWLLRADGDAALKLTPDGRTVLAVLTPPGATNTGPRRLIALDVATRQRREITSHGHRLTSLAISPSGRALVTGDDQGFVRVGPIEGGEPHLLLGHAAGVAAVTVSPDGKWIASASGSEIRLWPMPDVSKSPFHTLPYAELMARLRALTNVRIVEDKTTATGYKLDVAPFPGWKDVPAW